MLVSTPFEKEEGNEGIVDSALFIVAYHLEPVKHKCLLILESGFRIDKIIFFSGNSFLRLAFRLVLKQNR